MEFIPQKNSAAGNDQKQEAAENPPEMDLNTKSFVERSMYKRDMCKNWTEAGFCRYGTKCQYAHGSDELSDNN